ncbi:protein SCO1/2 [Allosediminivita pacifica]|uniref:Protein SCO1/2 n=2 Tax=Alphaproteobacteria TaxID=28211 RepID=A0A2T6ADI0_9RHOB|nr:protein SCO1/2 [Allosediminivita pacifica]
MGGAAALTGCRTETWYGKDVTGILPDLDFALTSAQDRQAVTEADYHGRIVALFFGFTFCPDICPMTLSNLAGVADRLGEDAENFSILFVTVDPERDTLPILADYAAAFTPRAAGLRGTPDQLARLARRLKVTYKVEPHPEGARDYAVSHGKSVYVFDRSGAARVLWPEFDTLQADVAAATEDIQRLITGE